MASDYKFEVIHDGNAAGCQFTLRYDDGTPGGNGNAGYLYQMGADYIAALRAEVGEKASEITELRRANNELAADNQEVNALRAEVERLQGMVGRRNEIIAGETEAVANHDATVLLLTQRAEAAEAEVERLREALRTAAADLKYCPECGQEIDHDPDSQNHYPECSFKAALAGPADDSARENGDG